MSANVVCTECGVVLVVQEAGNYHLMTDTFTSYYHIPNLNEHMQLHEGA